MKLALLISRTSQFPILESLARVAVDRGHEVVAILDQSLVGGPKAAQAPQTIPAWWPKLADVVPVRFVTSLGALLAHDDPAAVLEVYMPDASPGMLRSRGWRGKLCHVQGAISDLTNLDPAGYDWVYTWSPTWARLWAEWPEAQQSRSSAETANFRAVGYPQADLLSDPPVDSWERFRIAAGQPVVVYLPFPAATLRRHWWSHGVYTKPWPFVATERRVVSALRAYCDRIKARLVVKGLHRRGVASWIDRFADVVVWDDVLGEPTLLRLLQATDARMMVHHLSTGVSEAAVCGVPSLSIAPPRPRWLPQYAPRLRCPDFAAPGRRVRGSHQSFYDWWPGAISLYPRELIEALPIFGCDVTSEPEDTKNYRATFFGVPPYRAGERIIEDLEEITR